MSDEQVVEIFRRAGLAELMGYQHSAIDKVRNEKKSTALAELNGLGGSADHHCMRRRYGNKKGISRWSYRALR